MSRSRPLDGSGRPGRQPRRRLQPERGRGARSRRRRGSTGRGLRRPTAGGGRAVLSVDLRELPAEPPPQRTRACRWTSSTRTPTCWWSTRRRARRAPRRRPGAGHAGQRTAGSPPRHGHGRGSAPPRHRAPARPGHVRPAGGRVDRRRTRRSSTPSGSPGRAPLHGPRVGRPGGAPRRDRRADRPLAPPAHARPSWPAAGRYEVRAARPAGDLALLGCDWRPAGPTRSACTWRRSAIPSSATATTAASTALAVPRMFLHAEHLRLTTRSPDRRCPSTLRSPGPGRRPRRPRRPCFVGQGSAGPSARGRWSDVAWSSSCSGLRASPRAWPATSASV